MTERDRLYLAKEFESAMEKAQSTQAETELRGLSIHIHAPSNNQIYRGDHIEVHVHTHTHEDADPPIGEIITDTLEGVRRGEAGAARR